MTDTAWQDDVLRMKAQGLQSAEIAEAVGKHPATVRKVIARARDEAETPDPFAVQEPDVAEGQTTVDEQIVSVMKGAVSVGEVLAQFRAEAGEAVGPMPPPEPPADPEPTVVEKPRIDGTSQFAMDFGAALAVDAETTLTGKFASGFFRQGDIIRGAFTAVVRDVTGKGKVDRHSLTVEETKQRQVAEIVRVRTGAPSAPFDAQIIIDAADYLLSAAEYGMEELEPVARLLEDIANGRFSLKAEEPSAPAG